MNIRDATKAYARDLAYLINLAGEGLPEYLWGQMAKGNETPMDVGEQRAAREEGGFSYRHAKVCLQKKKLLGMILDYRLPAPYDLDDLDDCPRVVQPLLRLEAQAPGSWYINAIATYKAARRRGVASLLMAQAEASAIAAGCTEMSLIVASENHVARTFYEHQGFRETASLPIEPYPGGKHGGDWLLMTKRIDAA
ncbi:GNAT family N-acetyltransferase [Halomonas stenophila]|uniref:Ribosomal protein S18 acetylase RimI-like enzyme n=1 Tax=Halomonas stenophila TaxID=795312 RepID=A0A7W5ETP5_9GAMM|nr:GNAT family N-acetyltransferase [Halomonas stenophila]MBB3231269.1 ribosomal protein S18 acetylase RimI-like enzyme [Halomonas stenophila]